MPKPEFVLVPREPTEEMLRRADRVTDLIDAATSGDENATQEQLERARLAEFRLAYLEMLSAAPPSPSVDEEMLEALKPLAALAEVFDSPGGTTPTKGEIYTWSRMINGEPKDFTLTVEMLRAARAAIARDTGAKP